jgi:N-acetylmuramoyl-L-alanine amidase
VKHRRGPDLMSLCAVYGGHFHSCICALAAGVTAFFVLAVSFNTAIAATIEHYALRRIDNVVEIDFTLRGRAPRWQLTNHGQELWLDVEHSRLGASIEPQLRSAIFPLIAVSALDFGGGYARLIIRVSGKVDYVVAQTTHRLIVRIAPSREDADLTESLLAEIDQGDRSQRSLAAGERAARPPNADLTRGESKRAPADMIRIPNLPMGQSVVSVDDNTRPTVVSSRSLRHGQQPLVVIDAGHGGFDPGTESSTGIAEKTVALAIARRLEIALDGRGVDAVLTRSSDVFLSLAERTQIANQQHADLFVSIHLNSSADSNTSGIEAFYLNNSTDRTTIRLAQIENGGRYSTPAQPNLNYILTNLRQDYKAQESSSLARMIEVESAAAVDTTLGIRLNALGAKMGPFYVLVGAEMPSVLIECGFLSNPREAGLLVQPQYQQALADGIATAIVQYFNADEAAGNL